MLERVPEVASHLMGWPLVETTSIAAFRHASNLLHISLVVLWIPNKTVVFVLLVTPEDFVESALKAGIVRKTLNAASAPI
jgi:hypothetical protein